MVNSEIRGRTQSGMVANSGFNPVMPFSWVRCSGCASASARESGTREGIAVFKQDYHSVFY